MRSLNLILFSLCIASLSSQIDEQSFLQLEEDNRVAMKMSQRGFDLVKRFEDCFLGAHYYPTGNIIGYGRTTGVDKGMTITKEQADAFLVEDMAKFEEYVNRQSMSFEPNQNQFDALVLFSFNLGSDNLASLVKNRSKMEVADAILTYNKEIGKVLPRLTTRRNAERELFLS